MPNFVFLGSTTLYDHRWARVREDTVRLPDGTTRGMLVVEDAPGGAVHVLALTSLDEVVLINIPRYPMGERESNLELPGGWIGEQAPLEAAQREFAEETGLAAEHWQPLLSGFKAGHRIAVLSTVFLAAGLRKLTEQERDHYGVDPDELITGVVRMPFAEAVRQLYGEIVDVLTCSAIQALQISRLGGQLPQG